MRRDLPFLLATSALAAILLVATPGEADTSPEDRAAADALFRDGRALVKQGKLAEGCAKLAASHKLDPAAGSLLALGDCYEQNGQTASAWTTFNEAQAFARKLGDAPRAQEAERRAGLLDARLSRLTFVLPAGGRPEGLEVRRNEKLVDPSLFGSSIPVDPGPQTISVTAPGKREWRSTVTVEPKPGVTTVPIPELVDAPAPAASGTAAAITTGASSAAPAGEPPSFWSSRRTAGVVVAGAGLAGVVAGAVLGGLTLAKVGDVNSRGLCVDGEPYRCTEEGLRLQNEANDLANGSNVGFAAGGAALIAGVIVFLTAPSPAPKAVGSTGIRVAPAAGPGMAGLSIRGAW